MAIRVRSMWHVVIEWVVSLPLTVPGLLHIRSSTIITEVSSLTLLLLRRHLGHKAEVSSKKVSTIVNEQYSEQIGLIEEGSVHKAKDGETEC